MTHREKQQEKYALVVLFVLVAVWVFSSCSTVNLDCYYVNQEEGPPKAICRVPKEDKPIGGKGL